MNFLQQHTYGIIEQYNVQDEIDRHTEDIIYKGWTVIPNVLKTDQINKLKESILEIYDLQLKEFGQLELQKINDEFIVRAPLCYSELFVDLSINPLLIDVCRRIFGDSFILLMQNGIINNPANSQFQARWHRDLNYQHWVSSKILSINALFCLTDFNVATGGTYILPGTHLHEKFPSERYVQLNEVCAEAPAGSLILMNAMLFHRAGVNTSDNNRIGINHVIGLPFFAQQISLPKCMELKTEHDEFAAYFGYKWSPAENPLEWRKRKYNQR